MSNRERLFLVVLGTFVFFMFSVADAYAAARVYVLPDKLTAAKNEAIETQIMLENTEEGINALEITLEFPKDKLTLRDISDGGSIISFWAQKPQEIKRDNCLTGISDCGAIKISGLIPGGFIGNGLLAKLTFAAVGEGTAGLNFDQRSSKVFLDRPNAELADTSYESAAIEIAGEGSKKNALVLDYFPPEKFGIYLERSELVFDDKWFIIFAAQDKGSGIDHYDIKERFLGLFGDWGKGDSPYKLAHQTLFSIIEVRATDKIGNTRTEKFVPARMVYLLITVLISVLFLVVWLVLKLVVWNGFGAIFR